MPRNNLDRLPTADEDSNEMPDLEDLPKPTAGSYEVPTEFVDLPSQGRFYPEAHPLHGKDSVEIRFMTTADEDVLNNKSLIKKGVALDRVLQNLLVDKNVKVNSLLIGDKNALIVAARRTAFGPEYQTGVTCMTCLSNIKQTFDLSELENIPLEETELTEDKTVKLELPVSKAGVELRLLTGADEIEMRETEEKRKKHKLPSKPISDFLKAVIVSVNGDNNGKTIEDFVKNMITRDSTFLKKEYQRISPNIDLKQFLECTECGAEMEVSIPFSVGFFWPNG